MLQCELLTPEICCHVSTWKVSSANTFQHWKFGHLKMDSSSIPRLQSSYGGGGHSRHFKLHICWSFEMFQPQLFIEKLDVWYLQVCVIGMYFNDFNVHLLSRVFKLAPGSWRRWELSFVWRCWGWRGWQGCATTNTCWIWKATSLGHRLKWPG